MSQIETETKIYAYRQTKGWRNMRKRSNFSLAEPIPRMIPDEMWRHLESWYNDGHTVSGTTSILGRKYLAMFLSFHVMPLPSFSLFVYVAMVTCIHAGSNTPWPTHTTLETATAPDTVIPQTVRLAGIPHSINHGGHHGKWGVMTCQLASHGWFFCGLITYNNRALGLYFNRWDIKSWYAPESEVSEP